MEAPYSGTERRRMPRQVAPGPLECRVETRIRVRLLDISVSGALLASEVPLPVGSRALLRTTVATAPFSPQVEVQRASEGRQARESGFLVLGATFLDMDDRSRRSLEAFLQKASE